MNHLKYGRLEQDPRKVKESTQVEVQLDKIGHNLTESTSEGRFLMPRIEAIHAGSTRNDTVYLADKLRGDMELKSGVYSWLHPYGKPVIFNHDVNTENTGRIYTAAYADYTQAGRPGIIVVPKITEPRAIEGILGGRLLTVSIGATTDSVTCSYCGTDIVNEGFCGHMKGDVIDGRKVEWITGNLWFDELSWVNVPADSDAMIVDTQSSIMMATESADNGIILLGNNKVEEKKKLVGIVKESANDIIIMEGELAMTEEQIKALQEELASAKSELETTRSELETTKESLETKENEISTLTQESQQVLTEKEELETKASDLQEKLDETEKALTEKSETLSQLEEERESLKAALQEAKSQIEELETVTENLDKNVRESHVNHLATLRVAFGKESTYEEAVEKLTERSIDSIKDGIADMKEEMESRKGELSNLEELRQKVNKGKTVETQETVKGQLSVEEALVAMFRRHNK